MHKNDIYNKNIGVPKTSDDVNVRYGDLGRQTGKTKMLIDTLLRIDSRKKILVISHNGNHSIYIRDILINHGVDVSNMKFESIKARSINDTDIVKMIANNLHSTAYDDVFIDNCVWDIIYSNQRKEFSKFKAMYAPEKTATEKVKEIEEMFASEASEHVIMQEIKYMFGVKK